MGNSSKTGPDFPERENAERGTHTQKSLTYRIGLGQDIQQARKNMAEEERKL